MKTNQDKGDAWFQERFGRTPASRTWPKHRAFWYGSSVLIALGLLVSFYIVLNQSVSRAQQHWAEAGGAQRVSSSDGCTDPRARENCANRNAGSRLRSSGPAGMNVTVR